MPDEIIINEIEDDQPPIIDVTKYTSTDKDGVWEVKNGFRFLIEPSQEWIDAHQTTESLQSKPTTEALLKELTDTLIEKSIIQKSDLPISAALAEEIIK